jgi:hypothetical protein
VALQAKVFGTHERGMFFFSNVLGLEEPSVAVLAAIRASKMPGIEGRHVSAAPGTAQRVSVMMSLYLFISVLSGCELFVPYFDWDDDDEKAKYFTYLRDAETQMFARQCAAGCCPRWPLDGG